MNIERVWPKIGNIRIPDWDIINEDQENLVIGILEPYGTINCPDSIFVYKVHYSFKPPIHRIFFGEGMCEKYHPFVGKFANIRKMDFDNTVVELYIKDDVMILHPSFPYDLNHEISLHNLNPLNVGKDIVTMLDYIWAFDKKSNADVWKTELKRRLIS
jgi:hypothetical protein